jgi:hypothetical protein
VGDDLFFETSHHSFNDIWEAETEVGTEVPKQKQERPYILEVKEDKSDASTLTDLHTYNRRVPRRQNHYYLDDERAEEFF